MQGSRSLFLNARSARFIFGHDDDDFSEANSKEIIILGQADQDNATNIAGMELGYEPWVDKFPPEHNLPVVGYKFIVHSKEMTI